MGGERSGNIPGFRWESAEVWGKGHGGGSKGKGERGPTSRLAPPSRAGTAFRHTAACSDGGRVEPERRRGPSHPAASGWSISFEMPSQFSQFSFRLRSNLNKSYTVGVSESPAFVSPRSKPR